MNRFQKVYYHLLGTPQDQDQLVYNRLDQPDWGFESKVTEDGQYLVISVWEGTDKRNRFFYRPLEKGAYRAIADVNVNGGTASMHELQIIESREKIPDLQKRLEAVKNGTAKNELATARELEWSLNDEKRKLELAIGFRSWNAQPLENGVVELLRELESQYTFIGNTGSLFYMVSDLKARAARSSASMSPAPTAVNWKVIVPESEATLTAASVVGNHLVCQYLKDAASQGQGLRPRGQVHPRCRSPRYRHRRRLRGQIERLRDLLLLRQLHHPAHGLPLRRRHRQEHRLQAGQSRFRRREI